jgi:transposase
MVIPGAGRATAAVIIAEIGVDTTRFPTPAHLTSWAKFSPIISESAGRTDTFLGERYRRIARRRGRMKAIVAVGRSILTVVWYLLSDPRVREGGPWLWVLT